MKRKELWISLLIGVALCVVAGGVVWWKPTQAYCKVEQNPGFLEYKMCTNKKEYQFGEPVYITFTITNIRDDPAQPNYGPVEFGNGTDPVMDICDDELYACWSNNQTLTDDDKHFTLEPGESHTLMWTMPTSPEYLDHLEERMRHSHDSILRIDLLGCETLTSREHMECGPYYIIIYGRMSQLPHK